MAFKPNITGGGGGVEGALLAVNNLSDVPNDSLARQNIGAGDMVGSNNLSEVVDGAIARQNIGAGDMLASNNLSEVDPAQARTNIGAGVGDLLAANNLSELSDPDQARNNIGAGIGDLQAGLNLSDVQDTAIAKINIGADFYGNGEDLKFGNDTVDPHLKIGTIVNGDGSQVQRIEYKNTEDGVTNHLQIGCSGATYSNFDPIYTTNDFSDIPGLILRSVDENINIGLFPKLANTNLSFMLTGSAGLRMVADTPGGPGVLQLGQGGSSGVLNLSGNSSANNRIVASNGTGHSLYLNRASGSAIVRASDGARSRRPFYTSVGHVVPNTVIANSDYEINSEDYLITYAQLDASFTVQIPKLVEVLGYSGVQEPLTDRSFIFIIKDATGNCSPANTITINQIEGVTFDGQANYVLDRPFGSVTFMVCAVGGVENVLVINEK